MHGPPLFFSSSYTTKLDQIQYATLFQPNPTPTNKTNFNSTQLNSTLNSTTTKNNPIWCGTASGNLVLSIILLKKSMNTKTEITSSTEYDRHQLEKVTNNDTGVYQYIIVWSTFSGSHTLIPQSITIERKSFYYVRGLKASMTDNCGLNWHLKLYKNKHVQRWSTVYNPWKKLSMNNIFYN